MCRQFDSVLRHQMPCCRTTAGQKNADVAQLAEQLICNQQVAGSSPIISSTRKCVIPLEGFPSGQREQTVNLLSTTSVVRIHLPPPKKETPNRVFLFLTPGGGFEASVNKPCRWQGFSEPVCYKSNYEIECMMRPV